MLVLKRGINESVTLYVGDVAIVVKYLGPDRGGVGLAFEAPPEVEI